MRPLVALVLVLAGGCRASAAAERSAVDQDRVEARVEVEVPAEPSAPTWVGVVVAREAVDLSTEVAGTLAASELALGDWVEVEQVAAVIEAPLVEAELEGARAALRSAEAEQDERELLITDARRQRARERTLGEAGVSSAELGEQAELSVDKAIIAERRAAATVAERRAEVGRLQEKLAGAKLHAPFRGRVARWYRNPGEHVEAGERVIRIAAVDQLWVRFAVPVDELAQVREGVVISVQLVPEGRPLEAVVRNVAPELDLASQMLLVEAELIGADADGPAKIGQACYVSVQNQEPK